MKRLVLLCVCVAVGCARWSDMDSDAFSQGARTPEQFAVDDRACQNDAYMERSYSLRGIEADNAEWHLLYSRVYAACMKRRGYKPRTDLWDAWQAYNL
jgi:hypothetical protein